MDRRCTTSVRYLEAPHYTRARPDTPRHNTTIRARSRRLWICHWCRPHATTKRRQATSSWVLLDHPQPSGTQLRHLQLGATRHCQIPSLLETSACRQSSQDQGVLGSHEPSILAGPPEDKLTGSKGST